MKYRIERRSDGIDVELSDVGGREAMLTAAFRECQQTCSECPMRDHATLDSVVADKTAGRILLHFRVRSGHALDEAAVGSCLEHVGRERKA